MTKDYGKEYALMFSGYLQGKFSKASDVGGIDLKLHSDEEGVHGQYKSSEFTIRFTEELRRLGFRFSIKTPNRSKLIERTETSSLEKISRTLGRTIIERKKSHPDSHHNTYSATCSITPTLDHIRSPNDVFHELWEYIVKNPLSRV